MIEHPQKEPGHHRLMIKAWVFDFNMGRKNTGIVKIDYAIKQHRNI